MIRKLLRWILRGEESRLKIEWDLLYGGDNKASYLTKELE